MELRRESIFVSGVRALFNCFAGVLGIVLAVALIFFFIALSTGPSLSPNGTELAILPDANGKHDVLPESAPVILKLSIDGVIGDGELTGKLVDQILLDSREDFLKNDRVKALLLYIKTPGGTVDDADSIYRALKEYKKKYDVPVYAYVDGMCASGGMYICGAVDKIYASPTSLIGSVGVVMGPFFNVADTMQKVGASSLTISSGKDKDMLNPFRQWQPGEDASLKKISSQIYDRFVNVLTDARPQLDRTKLINEYGAHIFLSEEAQQLGYIDVAGVNYSTALADLAETAGISDRYQVVELQIPSNIFTELTKGKSPLINGKLNHSLEIGSNKIPAEWAGKFLYLYQQ